MKLSDSPIRRGFVEALAPTVLRVTPVAIVLCSALVLAWHDNGSFVASVWLPAAALAGLVLAVVLGFGAAVQPPTAAIVGIAGLIALAGWAAVSLTWSSVPTFARDEGLLTAFYAIVVALVVVTLRSRAEHRAATILVVAAVLGLTIATALELEFGSRPELHYPGRLYFPIDYVNAQAALFLVAFWPAVAIAARRRTVLFVRALALGGAAAFLGGWLLTQSKGGGLALLVSAVAVFAVSGSRLRLAVPVLIAAAGAAVAVRPLTAPYRASAETLRSSVRHAGGTLLIVAGAMTIVGLLYVLLDRRLRLSDRARRIAGVLALAALLAGLAGGVATFVVAVDRPGHYLTERWHSFKRRPTNDTAGSHLLSLGSNRYDFWRVALGEFERHPLNGIGARAFATDYLLKGRSEETPHRAHSLELDVLGETGLVGFLLLVAGVGVPLAAIGRRARRSLTAAGLLGAGTYWLAHSTVDWNWTFPAATLPALLLLGIGVAATDSPRTLPGRWAAPAGALAAALALLAFAPPWLSARFTQRALDDPSRVAADFRWARRLDPLSTDPLLAQAALAGSPGEIRYLSWAVRKEPRRSELHYRLGVAYLDAGKPQAAERELATALRLDPRDELVRRALKSARDS